MNWGPLILCRHHSSWTCWNSKLEMVKTASTCRKINAILISNKINLPKLVNINGYKLAANWQNFAEIYLAVVKILQKVLGGITTFLTHPVYVVGERRRAWTGETDGGSCKKDWTTDEPAAASWWFQWSVGMRNVLLLNCFLQLISASSSTSLQRIFYLFLAELKSHLFYIVLLSDFIFVMSP